MNHINILQNSICETWGKKFLINLHQTATAQLPSEKTLAESLGPSEPEHLPCFAEIAAEAAKLPLCLACVPSRGARV